MVQVQPASSQCCNFPAIQCCPLAPTPEHAWPPVPTLKVVRGWECIGFWLQKGKRSLQRRDDQLQGMQRVVDLLYLG